MEYRESQQQGRQANTNGSAIEGDVHSRLIRLGYPQLKRIQMEGLVWPEGYFVHHPKDAFQDMFGTPWVVDFYIWHPVKHPDGLVIESKSQEKKGSVDAKLVPAALSLLKLNIPSILLIAGDGFQKKYVNWCYEQQTEKFTVMNWNAFSSAVNRGLI